mmetsp:Transcript_18168/g.70246  ORF Transcript_18168/g.70246 Transcript_18168/m.70246 type:complete len:231 (+) Transcript_18168:2042-2734(+)
MEDGGKALDAAVGQGSVVGHDVDTVAARRSLLCVAAVEEDIKVEKRALGEEAFDECDVTELAHAPARCRARLVQGRPERNHRARWEPLEVHVALLEFVERGARLLLAGLLPVEGRLHAIDQPRVPRVRCLCHAQHRGNELLFEDSRVGHRRMVGTRESAPLLEGRVHEEVDALLRGGVVPHDLHHRTVRARTHVREAQRRQLAVEEVEGALGDFYALAGEVEEGGQAGIH